MSYIDAGGAKQRPIMIHRAIFGSIERFFGILIENYAGAFPVWLAPVQVGVVAGRGVECAYVWAWAA
jgi:threonyl-tRNA synthetase